MDNLFDYDDYDDGYNHDDNDGDDYVIIASCHDYNDRDLSWSNPDQQGLSVLILLLDLVSIIFLSVSSLSRVDNLII